MSEAWGAATATGVGAGKSCACIGVAGGLCVIALLILARGGIVGDSEGLDNLADELGPTFLAACAS